MFGGSKEEPTEEQEYEYRIEQTSGRGLITINKGGEVNDETFNELARKGWRLHETIEKAGSTKYLVFEREVEQ